MEHKQVIISISREFGSGGHEIAEKLAARFKLPFYDSNLLNEIAMKKHVKAANLIKYDEMPKNTFLYRSIRGYSNSPEDNIAQIQFNYIRKKADAGHSFVIVGRCAEEVLKSYDCMVSVFILGDMDKKIQRVAKKYQVTPSEAETMIKNIDKKRKTYHNYHCKTKWGDSRNYELSINSSKLSVNKIVDIIEIYVGERFGLIRELSGKNSITSAITKQL